MGGLDRDSANTGNLGHGPCPIDQENNFKQGTAATLFGHSHARILRTRVVDQTNLFPQEFILSPQPASLGAEGRQRSV